MRICRGKKGQTLIETALVLLILFGVLFAITEFARAWFTKNSLKNAARQGARVAVVMPNVADSSYPNINCSAVATCPYAADSVINAICCQPGVKRAFTTATVDVVGGAGPAINGDIIQVLVRYNNPNFFVLGGGIWPWPKQFNVTTSVSMRYE